MRHVSALAAAILVSSSACDRDRVPPPVPQGDATGSATIDGELLPPGGDVPLSNTASHESRWVVAATATLSIGGNAVGPGSDLHGIVGLARLEDGSVLIGDRAQRVSVFDAAGDYVRTFGGRGGGPGEFGAMTWIQRLPGDTVLVSDFSNNRRLSYFTPEGAFVRSVNASGVQRVVAALADGSVVGMQISYGSSHTPGPPGAVEWGRDEVGLLRLGVDGRVLNSLGRFPGIGWINPPDLGLMTIVDEASPLHATLVVGGGDRIYLTTGERFEIKILTPQGQTVGVIQEEHDLVPVTEGHLVDFFRVLTSGSSAFANTRWEALQWNVAEGRTLPVITALRLDDEGNLWIGERRAGRNAVQTWHVYSRTGEKLAAATMPAGFRPFSIGTENVLGVWQDHLGVEYVQLRTIAKH